MEDIKQKSWWGRNWLWVLPVGGCLTVIVLVVFGVGALFFGVTKLLKESTPYEQAMTLTNNNTEVIALLGEPIETDGMTNGNISLANDEGEAHIKIPIKGSIGKAKVIVKAQKTNGVWSYDELYVLIKETQEKIHLIDKDLEGI